MTALLFMIGFIGGLALCWIVRGVYRAIARVRRRRAVRRLVELPDYE